MYSPLFAPANSEFRLPLLRHCVLDSQDVDEARDKVRQIVGDSRLQLCGDADKFRAQLNHRPLPRVGMASLAFGADCRISDVNTRRHYISIACRGAIAHQVDGQDITISGKDAVVLDGTQNMVVDYLDDAYELDLCIDSSELQLHLQRMTGESVETPREFDLALDLSHGHGASLYHLILYMLCELDRPDSMLNDNIALVNLEDMLLSSLLYGQPHNHSRLLHSSHAQAGPAFVRMAEEYIDTHAQEPIGIRELTGLTGVSAPSLFCAFRRYRGYTPMQYLKRTRLDRVHESLLDSASGDSVSTLAFRWGFTHLGRFAEAYRARFGETPSATRARRRAH